LLHAVVHPADIQDRHGGVLVIATLFAMFSILEEVARRLRVSRIPKFAAALRKLLDIEIVKRSDTAIGFKIVPERWVVERTIAWLNRCRRLAKGWENLNCKALALHLMLRKLCNPARTFRTDS